jgi:plasmid stabilization system protein ParE
MTVRLAPQARRDLHATLAYLAERNPRAGLDLHAGLLRTLDLLATGVLDGPEAALPAHGPCRRFYVHPWWVYYRRQPGGMLEVLRLYHYARKPPSAGERR